ncbi:probable serine/threonine-protein kinase clkA isoform X4 [Myzus persicae]|uniref:probable serine/threonine-protein kinase clkA isoform X4 n=1 Tax=Myzus persicae TaxID=13164 RepID=UPI000B937333|nr:probable serine/threonine-protein kinase clkA isoform X4 [Myzus persicae]
MILFSQTLIVSILAFVVAVQADTQQTLNSNELSLSNEQVTQYKYEKTIQSETIENNQDNSITTSINTEIAQKTHSNNELDLNNVDDTDLNSALKVDVTAKLNGLESASNGNNPSDNGFAQSSKYYEHNVQNMEDLNGRTPTTPTSSPGSSGSPSSAAPTYPNGNLNSDSGTASDVYGMPSQPFMPLTYPMGVPSNINGGVPKNPQTPNPNSDNGSPKSNINGGTPTKPTSSLGSNGSPSNTSPNSPNGDLTGKLDSNGNLLTDNSYMKSYESYYYGYDAQNDVDQNGGSPTIPTSSPGSNGSPSNISPNYPNGGLTDKPMEQFTDSYGNKLTVNSYQSPNENGFFQNIADQESSYPHLPEMSEGLNNQITQKSVSALNVQNTGTTDQFSFYPGIPSIMPNENSNDALSGGDLGWNSPTDINGSPQPVDQTPTVTEYSSMDSETYRFLKYDNMGYELQNTDVDEVLNDGQVNMDDSSVNSARSSDGDYNIQNDGNNVDGYFENIGYDNGNLQVPSYDSYTPNLNAGYENSEPLRGNTFTGNVPYDNNIYPGNILYNYNNIDDIENDQTKTGIDELNPENNQLSRTDFNTFSNTQTSLTTDSYLDTDLSSDRMVYDFVDGDNIGTETIDSNYIGQVNENNVYDGQGFNGFNMKSTNVPEYNQLNKLNRDYATTYLGNSRTFEASSSNTGTNADIDSYDGPQLFNSEYNFPTSSDLHKQSSDLNEQSSDLNNLVIGNVQLEKYLYHTTDTSNVNTLVEGTNEDDSNGFLTNTEDNRLKSIQTAVLIKNNALDVGQNVYGANGQVIGKIYKPSNGTARTNNRHKYSGGSSYSSPSDSELSDDLHAIGHDVKQSAHGAISNVHDHIKDAYNTTKAVGKAVGSIVGNAVSDAVDDVQETAKNAYQGSKDAVKDVGNAVSGAVDDVQDTAKNAYQGSKDAVKDVGNAVNGAVDDVQETAKTAYQGLKNDVNAIENAVSDATDSVEKTAGYLY